MALVNLENKKQIIMIVVAVLVGIVASALVGSVVSSQITEETHKISYKYEKDMKKRDQEHREELAVIQQQMRDVESRAQRAAADAARAVAAQSVPVPQVEAVAHKKPSLALRTPSGKRAITVLMDSLSAVGGLINPGDFVDVIAHLNMTRKMNKDKETVTAMIFQNIQILAINTNIDDAGSYDSQMSERSLKITFAVDPQEAGLLAFAEGNGKLELVLRTANEKNRTMLPTANWSTLAEYVLENTGADLQVVDSKKDESPKTDIKVETENVQETKPYIQIYRAGKEL